MPNKPSQGRIFFRLLASICLLLVSITLLAGTCVANTGKELLYTQQLQAIGSSQLTKKREFDDLLTILDGHETILAGERCQLDVEDDGLGLLFITDNRLIFIDEYGTQTTTISLPLGTITNVINGKNIFWGFVSLTSDSHVYTFTNISKHAAPDIAKRLTQLTQQRRSPNPASSLSQELQQLHNLKRQGILTPNEFEQAKAKLLNQL